MEWLSSNSFMVSYKLKLSKEQLEQIWSRKKAVEERFNVHISSHYFEGKAKSHPKTPLNSDDLYCLLVKGEKSHFEALKKYVEETFIQSQVVSSVFYDKGLRFVLGNKLWTEVLEKMYAVCVTIGQESLCISGTSSSVLSAISSVEELTAKYKKYRGMSSVSGELKLVKELHLALVVCKSVEVDINMYSQIPKEVVALLLSWLKVAYKMKFVVHSVDPANLDDDDVLILDVPDKKADFIEIVIGSDDEDEQSLEDPNKSSVSKTVCKRTKQMSGSNKKQKTG